MMRELWPLDPSGTMNAAAPKQGTPASDRWQKFKKISLPAVPRRGPEAEVHRVEYDLLWKCNHFFICMIVSQWESCPFSWFRNEFNFFMSVLYKAKKQNFDKLLFRNKKPLHGAICWPLFPVHFFSWVFGRLNFLGLFVVLCVGNRE